MHGTICTILETASSIAVFTNDNDNGGEDTDDNTDNDNDEDRDDNMPERPTTPDPNSDSSLGIIIGSSVGVPVVLIVLLVMFLVLMFIWRSKTWYVYSRGGLTGEVGKLIEHILMHCMLTASMEPHAPLQYSRYSSRYSSIVLYLGRCTIYTVHELVEHST